MRLKARFSILAGCSLAIAVSLFTASIVAARARPSEEPPFPLAQEEPAAAANATAPPAVEREDETPPVERGEPQKVFPVPEEAVASTQARAMAGESLVPRRPTPAPRRPTIILDPGHGRGDPGAVHHAPGGEVDLTEAESNLAIAEHLRRLLEEKGFDVYMTRAGDGKPLGPRPLAHALISADLMARVRLAQSVESDLFVSVHSNGSVNPNQAGVEMWYCGEHQFGKESARLAELALDAAMTGLRDYGYEAVRRGVQEDASVHRSEGFCQFLVTREVDTPAILTELLFLTNDADAAALKDDRAREAMAIRLADAIEQFLREEGKLPPS
ncbi:MAG: N-acetylmuramoyl-L-alanine amidase [Dehalococcoidia bacterium]|nr:N-acetylmuramoyl-L-alanine amidase [Dehalococcoidia bacterium]